MDKNSATVNKLLLKSFLIFYATAIAISVAAAEDSHSNYILCSIISEIGNTTNSHSTNEIGNGNENSKSKNSTR